MLVRIKSTPIKIHLIHHVIDFYGRFLSLLISSSEGVALIRAFLPLFKMATAILTGRIILKEAERLDISPCDFSDFTNFTEEFIIKFHGISKPVDPYLQEQITEFLSEWPKRIRNLFRDKYGYKWDRMLNGNHPKYFDREIRFTRPTPPPVPPVSAGSFLNL